VILWFVLDGCFTWIPADDPLYDPGSSDSDITDDGAFTDDATDDVTDEDSPPPASDQTIWGLFRYASWGPFSFAGVVGDPDWRYEDVAGGVLDGCTLVEPAPFDALPADEDSSFSLLIGEERFPLVLAQASEFQTNTTNVESYPFRGVMGVALTGWPDVADVEIAEFVEMPPATWLQVTSPELRTPSQGPLLTWPGELTVQWERYDRPANALWITLHALNSPASSLGTLRCLARDDGEFTLPVDMVPDYPLPAVLEVRVGRLFRQESVVTLEDGTAQRRLGYAEAYASGNFCAGDCTTITDL
jgi:hypothetical protein